MLPSNVDPLDLQKEDELVHIIDGIFLILQMENFSLKINIVPKSSIESEMVKEERKSIPLLQSTLIMDSINVIKIQLKLH